MVARAGGGEVLVTRPVVELADGVDGLEFDRIGEVRLKGFSEPTELFLASPREALSAMDPRASVRAAVPRRRPARPGRSPLRRDALRRARLGLPARRGGRAARRRRGQRAARQLRAARGGGRRARSAASSSARARRRARGRRRAGGARAGRSAGQPAGLGARGPLRAAPRGRRAQRCADRHRPHRQRPGRDDPLPAGRLAGAARAARHARRAEGPPGRGRCSRVDREQTAAYCASRGLAWREDASNERRPFARARVRHGLLAALRAVHPAAEANVLRTAALLREETELLDGLVAPSSAGAGASRSRACGSCPPRWRGWWSCAWPSRPPATYVPAGGRPRRGAARARRAAAAARSCTWAGRPAR